MISAKVIKPKVFTPQVFQREFEKTAHEVVDEQTQDFAKTTRTFDHKPGFSKTVKARTSRIVMTTETDDENYRRIVRGTPPHTIRAVNAPVLHFKGTFKAKTKSRVIASYKGSQSGPDIFATEVHHPGTAPRDFDLELADRWSGKKRRNGGNLKTKYNEALSRAVKASGHALGGA